MVYQLHWHQLWCSTGSTTVTHHHKQAKHDKKHRHDVALWSAHCYWTSRAHANVMAVAVYFAWRRIAYCVAFDILLEYNTVLFWMNVYVCIDKLTSFFFLEFSCLFKACMYACYAAANKQIVEFISYTVGICVVDANELYKPIHIMLSHSTAHTYA